MKAPTELLIAAALQWLAAAIGLVQAFTLIIAGIAMSDASVEASVGATLTSHGIKRVDGHTVSAGVLLAGTVLLTVALARIIASWFLVQGRTWARIVITLLVLVSLLSGIAYLFNDETVRGVLTVAIEVVILYLLFNGKSSDFIARATAEKVGATTD